MRMMAVMPMTMPSTVSMERDLCVLNPLKAVFRLCLNVILRSGFRPLIPSYLIAICLCDDVVELLNIPVVGNPTSPHRTSELNLTSNMARPGLQRLKIFYHPGSYGDK